MLETRPATTAEFAVRLASADALFDEFDARPIADRPLREEVHEALLDEWERVRHAPPAALTLVLPEAERTATDEEAVRAAVRSELRVSRGPLRRAGPLSRTERVTLCVGVLAFLICVAVGTAIENSGDDDVVQAVAQGLTLAGWVALWAPAAHFFKAIVPHAFNRRRYAEFAELDIDFRWV